MRRVFKLSLWGLSFCFCAPLLCTQPPVSLAPQVREGFLDLKNQKRAAKSKPPLSPEMVSIEPLNKKGEGGQNKGIYRIFKNGRLYFGKVLINPQEAERYKALQLQVAEFNSKDDFPKFVQFRGELTILHSNEEEHVLLLDPAPGVQLDVFMKTDLMEMPPAEAIEHLENIARKLGNFHSYNVKLIYDYSGFPHLKGWVHGDISVHLGNVFYDKKTKSLTFIDYEDMEYKINSETEVNGFFRNVGYILMNTNESRYHEDYAQAFINAYLKVFPEGPIKIIAEAHAWQRLVNYVFKGEIRKKSEQATTKLKQLKKVKIYPWRVGQVDDQLRKQLRSLFKTITSIDYYFEKVNDISDDDLGVAYELVTSSYDGNRVFWLREGMNQIDIEKHQKAQKLIIPFNKDKSLPQFFPLFKTGVVDNRTDLIFQGSRGVPLSQYLEESIFSDTKALEDQFTKIGGIFGKFNARNCEIRLGDYGAEIHGWTHGLLWYTRNILYNPTEETVGFFEYSDLGFQQAATGISVDAYRLFHGIGQKLANILDRYATAEKSPSKASGSPYQREKNIVPEYIAQNVEAIVHSLVNGYLSAFSNPDAKIILKPVIYNSLKNQLGNYSRDNNILQDMATDEAITKVKMEKDALDNRMGYQKKEQVSAQVISSN